MLQKTDNSSRGRGFAASYKTECGGRKIVGDGVEMIRSPNYPLNYDPNTNCTWTLMGALPGTCLFFSYLKHKFYLELKFHIDCLHGCKILH